MQTLAKANVKTCRAKAADHEEGGSKTCKVPVETAVCLPHKAERSQEKRCILYRQALIKYSEKYGVTKAAIRYKTNRQYIYRWKNRYDGTLESLADRSHRPHHHSNEHTADELKLIADMRKRNANAGLVVFWVKLRQRGYTRSITGLYRLLRRQGKFAVKPPNPKYMAKPYEKMQYPEQRVQIDVKFVPEVCIVGESKGKKFYLYTAIDEYSRFRYLEAFEEHSTYSSAVFLEHMLARFPFKANVFRPTMAPSLPKG